MSRAHHGEECFTNDVPDDEKGEAVVVVSKQQPQTKRQQTDAECMNTAPLQPKLAFMHFAGSVFDTRAPGPDFSSSSAARNIIQLSSREVELSARPRSEQAFETPLERYYRIRNDLSSFKQDLETLSGSSNADAGASGNDGSVVMPRHVVQVATEIGKQLQKMEAELAALGQEDNVVLAHALQQSSSSSSVKRKDDLDTFLTQLRRASALSPATAAAPAAAGAQTNAAPSSSSSSISIGSSSNGNGSGNGGGSGVTVELLYNPDAKQAEDVREQLQRIDIAQVEQRVAHLEKAVGVSAIAAAGAASSLTAAAAVAGPSSSSSSSTSATATSSFSSSSSAASLAFPDLTTGLVQLHRKLEMLDNAKLEWVFRRTKLLALELEALEQQRNRTVAGDRKNATQQDEQVNAVYEQMSRWDKVAQQLPVIVARLQSLRDLHNYLASVAGRVAAMQQKQQAIQEMLKEDSAALRKLMESVETNAAVMQSNVAALSAKMAALDEKFNKLSASS